MPPTQELEALQIRKRDEEARRKAEQNQQAMEQKRILGKNASRPKMSFSIGAQSAGRR